VLAELIDILAIIFGTLLGVLALYMCVRVMGKAWYRSKREEEGVGVRRIDNNHLRSDRGGINHGKE
jgi:hypothetical protein